VAGIPLIVARAMGDAHFGRRHAVALIVFQPNTERRSPMTRLGLCRGGSIWLAGKMLGWIRWNQKRSRRAIAGGLRQ
jgi:hypothetical protein